MAGKTGKMVSLEAIEEHLKRQDKKMIQSLWWSYAATIGLPIFLIGLAGWGGVKMASNPNCTAIYWLIVAFVGVIVISIGVSMAVTVLQRNSTIKKK
jgi:fatty acid desaturase